MELERIIPAELAEQAARGEINPYLVHGVDVYLPPEIATRDQRPIDRTKPIPLKEVLPGSFFSERCYKVTSVLVPDLTDYLTSVPGVKTRLTQLEAKGLTFLVQPHVEFSDGEAAFLATPLTPEELKQLLFTPPQYH